MTNSRYEIPEIQDPFENLNTKLIHSDARTYFENSKQRDYFLHAATRIAGAMDNLSKLRHGVETCQSQGRSLRKTDLLEIMDEYTPEILEDKSARTYFRSLPNNLEEEELESVKGLLSNQHENYEQTASNLERFVEKATGHEAGGGLKRTINYISKCMFRREGEELEPDLRTDYKPNDGSIHNWLENMWIDAHNHIVKNWSR